MIHGSLRRVVMFCNTCPGFHKQSAAFTTSEIPRHQVLHSNSVVVDSQPWILFTVKSCLLISPNPATMCSPFMYISQLLCFCPHHVYPWPHPLTPITPPFSLTNAMPIDPYIGLQFLYDIFIFKYQLWFLSLTTWPHLDSPMKPSVPNFWKTWSLQRSSFLPNLYAPLSLDYTPSSRLLLNSQTTSNTSRFLGVPGTHLKYLDKCTRWVQHMSWSQCPNYSWFWFSSAMHHSTSWQDSHMNKFHSTHCDNKIPSHT